MRDVLEGRAFHDAVHVRIPIHIPFALPLLRPLRMLVLAAVEGFLRARAIENVEWGEGP